MRCNLTDTQKVMTRPDIFLYSPFSTKTIKDPINRALLIQFILSELFHAKDAHKKDDPLEFVFSSPACFFPYDWSYEIGCLNKIYEHAQLLDYAFPNHPENLKRFHECLDHTFALIAEHKKQKRDISNKELVCCLKNLYLKLHPFIFECKDSENLLLFLLKNIEEIAELAYPQDLTDLLSDMYPEGTQHLGNFLRLEYQKRGFTTLLPEIDRLLAIYEQ